ncbi:hypothetical protein CRG98_025256 [Punica granatum]|uniref:Uncharacterized protein n=1 Tax=Punica granatum TaxID=22663 RepID=A0A2I0JEL5_PUNGR|nr:hypothetical protein CRG98_025256 [Punica granatum]
MQTTGLPPRGPLGSGRNLPQPSDDASTARRRWGARRHQKKNLHLLFVFFKLSPLPLLFSTLPRPKFSASSLVSADSPQVRCRAHPPSPPLLSLC